MFKKILLCIDGEEHTVKAEEYAIYLAKLANAELYVLHVIDQWLLSRNISHEIFATGRDEYISYVKGELSKQAEEIISRFLKKAEEFGVEAKIRIREGTPAKEILAEVNSCDYDLVILGGKSYKSKLERLKSYRTPEKVLEKISTPLLVIKG
jgi:nucleotide-binding universal stress UspA family protein